MAKIPSKSKTNNLEDSNMSLEAVLIIFLVVLIGNKVLENCVHNSLSFLLLALIILIIGFFIPSSKNKGKNGYMRISISIKYLALKIRERIIYHDI
ncbi:hypothetical protein [Thomasclavelia cocleata]|uniref:hypothetical protein n=1 Tax=Thomasclavelia cocleata TaxID=69824 RepID=UPI002570729A|nr:hypothetical protein [Thomasclavelia cocleata]